MGSKVIKIPDVYFEGLDPEHDDGDLWRGIRRWQAARSLTNLQVNERVLLKWSGTKSDWTQFSQYHWGYPLCGSRLDYWPSKNHWRWHKKNYHGNIASLIGFIKNREGDNHGR